MSVKIEKPEKLKTYATDLKDGQLAVITQDDPKASNGNLHGTLVQKNRHDLVAVACVTPQSFIHYFGDDIIEPIEVRVVPNGTILIVRDNQ